MGVIAENVELSRKTLGNTPFQDWFDRPGFLTSKDLPYLPPPYASLWERAEGIVQDMRDDSRAAQAAGFAERTQSGAFPWAGPPGIKEARPQHTAPEESPGSVFNWYG